MEVFLVIGTTYYRNYSENTKTNSFHMEKSLLKGNDEKCLMATNESKDKTLHVS